MARAKKVRVIRVIDGGALDPWAELEAQLSKLEAIVQIVKRVQGDAAAVTAASDDDAKRSYLEEAVKRIKGTLQSAKGLADDEKRRVVDRATRAIEDARDLERTISAPSEWGYQYGRELNEAASAAADLLPWYAATIAGVAVGWWIAVGVGAWLYFSSKKGDR